MTHDNIADVKWMPKKHRRVVRGVQDSVLNDKESFDPKVSANFATLVNARRAHVRLVAQFEKDRGTGKNTYIRGQIMQGKLTEIAELRDSLLPKLVVT